MDDLSQAAVDVLAERRRQVEVEGWTAKHDEHHHRGQLAKAAAAYAYFGSLTETQRKIGSDQTSVFHSIVQQLFPAWGTSYGGWDWQWWKPKSRRQDLVRAAALIIADIERLDRRGDKVE